MMQFGNSCANVGDRVVGPPAKKASSPVVVASVVVLLGTSVLTLGDSTYARAEVRDQAGALLEGQTVLWSTSDHDVAWATTEGKITASKTGTAAIIGSVGSVTGSTELFVMDTVESQSGLSIPPRLPLDSVDVSWPATTGSTIVVNAGDNLQAALDRAKRGDEVVLQAGATFTGNFVLKAKPGSGWVTVRTSDLSSLPPLGQRVSSAHYGVMPKLVSPNVNAVLATASGASGWRLVGLEMTLANGVAVLPNANYGIVLLGDGSRAQNDATLAARDLILDRVYVHGQTNTNTTRCVALNSGATAIIGSHLLECHAKGYDAQAVGGWNGPGPYLIENNRLEASGEVIIFGGSDPAIPNLISSDITIRRNYLTRPMSWQGQWTVKNLFELKNAQRVLFEANVLENHWVDAQAGSAIVLGSVNQSGNCTWCVVQDVTIRYNHVHNVAAVFNIFARCGKATPNGPYGCDQGAQQTRRVKIEQNLFTNVGVPGLNAGGSAARIYLLQSDVHDVWIERNTGFAPYSYLSFVGTGPRAKQRFTFRGNVGGNSQYNWFSSQGQGDAANNSSLVPPYVVQRNVFVGSRGIKTIPGGSIQAPGAVAAAFNALTQVTAISSLGGSSAFSGQGVDLTELQARIAGVAQ
jgi:hypothetical protein